MEIEAVINKMMKSKVSQVRVAFPAIIMNIDNLKDGLVDVKPIVNQHNPYNDEWTELPTIRDVRVIFPSTKNSTICFPLELGDTVELIFQSASTQKFVDGNTDVHNPLMKNSANLRDVVALAGYQTFQESCFNANNYSNEFSMDDLNIVHNKGQDSEVNISLTRDGNIKVNSQDINIEAENINTNDALITVDNDIVIQGISLIEFIKTHTHNYTDDGSPMVTAKPNI